MKKLPFLLDQLPHTGAWMDSVPSSLSKFITRGRAAKRFLVEPDTAMHIFGLMFEHPDLYESQRQFAKPPFPDTYVEFRFDERTANPFAFAGVLRQGDTATLLTAEADQIIRVDFKQIHFLPDGLLAKPWPGRNVSAEEDPNRRVVAFAGMTEVLWLLMHRPNVVRIDKVPTKQQIIKGKLRPFRAHSVLTIDLSRQATTRIIQDNGSRGPNREHQVRGSRVHLGISRSCTHDWHRVEMPEGRPERYECARCKGIRVWRRDHVRGDGKLGTKFHTYEVKT